ncbi:MAG TPA: STAS domain-containing protein [Blastococcus sp.]|nr:STAS domain-containing protein [Blastococcus sp.]
MDETDVQQPDHGRGRPEEPEVSSVVEGTVAVVTVTGELTEGARRPLVRVLTDVLLQRHDLAKVELRLAAVSFMNSAGMAVLVQVQRMAAPRGVEVALVDPPAVVLRPLQLNGLWHRFPILGEVADAGVPDGPA